MAQNINCMVKNIQSLQRDTFIDKMQIFFYFFFLFLRALTNAQDTVSIHSGAASKQIIDILTHSSLGGY